MKYYAAITLEREVHAPVIQPPYNVLASYHYFGKMPELIKDWILKGYDIFVDSGAFSAETQKKPISLPRYCNFIKETSAQLYAGLDVIGDPVQTAKNVEIMEKEYGLSPMPTFHLGSDIRHLYNMMEGYHYIALGGLVFAGGVERYCDEVWSIILKHKPSLRVHGFGMTNIDLMERYPWYSVDSSSYKACRRFGRQSMLWNGLEWKTMSEDEFKEMTVKIGINYETINNVDRFKLYDYFSVQSFKVYAAHLGHLNKIRNFDYLTSQNKLF